MKQRYMPAFRPQARHAAPARNCCSGCSSPWGNRFRACITPPKRCTCPNAACSVVASRGVVLELTGGNHSPATHGSDITTPTPPLPTLPRHWLLHATSFFGPSAIVAARRRAIIGNSWILKARGDGHLQKIEISKSHLRYFRRVAFRSIIFTCAALKRTQFHADQMQGWHRSCH